MGVRSLGWGVREKGRRMNGEMRVGGRVEEMSSFFGVFMRDSFCLNRPLSCLRCGWKLELRVRQGPATSHMCICTNKVHVYIRSTSHECAYHGLRAL